MSEIRSTFTQLAALVLVLGTTVSATPVEAGEATTLSAGHPSLQSWLMPDVPPHPADNKPSLERVELGKMLFFDPRLSGDGNMSCATCHNPMFGWSDGLPTARGFKSQILGRATPTIVNTAYNSLQMWDGRKHSLEDQAMGPLEADVEMNMVLEELFVWLKDNGAYKRAFSQAYPDEPINAATASKAIASFERTVVSNNSPFDAWLRGDESAMSAQQVNGFKVFLDPAGGNCAACHQAPNFTDDGFHNVGLASAGNKFADPGRYAQKPIKIMTGAFKTPTLRDVAHTAPYFHDGSAATLTEVVEHYSTGGLVKTHLSPNMKKLDLSTQDKADLVAFMHALSSPQTTVALPTLPQGGPVSWADWRRKAEDDEKAIAQQQ